MPLTKSVMMYFIGNAVTYSSFFGSSLDIAPVISDEFSCAGNEHSLSQCSNYTDNSYCDTAVGVYCFGRYYKNIITR